MLKIFIFTISLLVISNARADWQVVRHDCDSVGEYAQSNSGAFMVLVRSIIPFISAQNAIVPSFNGFMDLNYIGIGVSAIRGFLQVGGSPAAAINLGLGFVCLKLENKSEIIEVIS